MKVSNEIIVTEPTSEKMFGEYVARCMNLAFFTNAKVSLVWGGVLGERFYMVIDKNTTYHEIEQDFKLHIE